MGAFDDGIRIGESVGLSASALDPELQPADLRAATAGWAVLGSTGVIALTTSTAGALHRIATAQAPGTRTVEFTSLDYFGNPVNATRAITVIDANGLRFQLGNFSTNLAAEWVSGSGTTDARIRLRLDTTAPATLRVSVLPVDGRDLRSIPAYTVGTYKAHGTTGKANIELDGLIGGATSTSTDRHFDLELVSKGTNVYTASAVTANGATISGTLRIAIASANTASLSTSAEAL
jgi:hypothetical protein